MAKNERIMVVRKDDQEWFVKFKWTISRGRDTYGYNICTAFVNSGRVGRCNGGGYDMEGVALAPWLEQFVSPDHSFYGLRRNDHNKPTLDGAVGLSHLLHSLGFTYKWID